MPRASCLYVLSSLRNGAQERPPTPRGSKEALGAAFEAERIIVASFGASEARKTRYGHYGKICQKPKTRRRVDQARCRDPEIARGGLYQDRDQKPAWLICQSLRPCPFGHFGDGNLHFKPVTSGGIMTDPDCSCSPTGLIQTASACRSHMKWWARFS